jgi:hypothetical protein
VINSFEIKHKPPENLRGGLRLVELFLPAYLPPLGTVTVTSPVEELFEISVHLTLMV